jgi:hypothetical protein
VQDGKYVWDNNKSIINFRKHGVSFNEAWTVFDDEFAICFPDDEHSYDEERFIIIGESVKEKLLMVCYCERENNDVIRIISARKADKSEKEIYYGGMV